MRGSKHSRASCWPPGILRFGIGLSLALIASRVDAEPLLDRVLSDASVHTQTGCWILRIGFNFRVRYISHFPGEKGRELRIKVQPIDRRGKAPYEGGLKREALVPPRAPGLALSEIEFETARSDGPTLVLHFERTTAFKVAQGRDFGSIIVSVAHDKSQRACAPEFPQAALSTSWQTALLTTSPSTDKLARLPGKRRPNRSISKKELRSAAASMDEARAALKRKKMSEAIRLFNKVLNLPESKHSVEAQELLAVSYQRTGNLDRARAEYRDFLKRYGIGEHGERVRQRLAAIEPTPRKFLKPQNKERRARNYSKPKETGTRWSVTGGISQFYILDNSYRKINDPSLPPDFNQDPDEKITYQNALISNVYLSGRWENEWQKTTFKFSAVEEHNFEDVDNIDIIGVSSLYVDTFLKSPGIGIKVGRQTYNRGGVLGRFDGAHLSWQASETLQFNAIVGSPALSRRDSPLKGDTLFYGGSVDINKLFGKFDTSLFAFEQKTEGFIDRRAIGFETRYFDSQKSLFASVDYDVYYNQLNLALLNGSWTLPNKVTLTASVDYRTSPYLLTFNALQGQFVASLDELSRTFTRQEIEQLARDRTAIAKSASLGVTVPIAKNLQLGFDATVANISGTSGSGNVAATKSTGNEYYYAAQLIASDLFMEGDTSIFSLRFVDRELSNTYVADINTRFPVGDKLRVNPRLRFTYLEAPSTDLTEFAVVPSVVFNYSVAKDLNLELELGSKWSTRGQGAATEEELEYFFTIGYRYDFFRDHRSK